MSQFGGVAEYTTITGTGNYTGLKPIRGAMKFGDRVATGTTVTIIVTDGVQVERSQGVYSSSLNRITRVTVLFPASGAISWGAGRKIVSLDWVSGISFSDISGVVLPVQGGTG